MIPGYKIYVLEQHIVHITLIPELDGKSPATGDDFASFEYYIMDILGGLGPYFYSGILSFQNAIFDCDKR